MSSSAGGGVGVAGSLARFGSKGFKHDRAGRGGAKEAYVAVAATKVPTPALAGTRTNWLPLCLTF